MAPSLYQAITLIVPLVFAIVFHEVAHGLTARALGDPTAYEARRLTLNPLRHIDLLGTVILPGLLAFAHLPVFGWAKPVPVDMRRLRNPRRDMMMVAAAGPLANLLMALAAAIGLAFLVRVQGEGMALDGNFWGDNLVNFLSLNLYLALFNLIPIPPFDGSHIIEGLLPSPAARIYRRARRWGMLVPMLVLVVLPMLFPGFNLVGRLIDPPFHWLGDHMLAAGNWIASL